ncbi:uncharacterized protein INSC1020_2100 [Saccharomyces cerevisiae]|uniref:EC1118_1B15_3807p n=1 Tax=Saccharomyces cerevisiae (strain Lalvin EC1118 / Prise de mousse) TaxID=643680 RepID=D3UEV6_YEAS8
MNAYWFHYRASIKKEAPNYKRTFLGRARNAFLLILSEAYLLFVFLSYLIRGKSLEKRVNDEAKYSQRCVPLQLASNLAFGDRHKRSANFKKGIANTHSSLICSKP